MKDNTMELLAVGLTILFVALKLLEVIVWPWWLVFMPMIVLTGVALTFVLIAAFGFATLSTRMMRSDTFPDLED